MSFYVLKPEGGLFGTKWAYADILDPQNTEDVGPRCPVCGKTVGPLVWLLPHRIKLSSAKPEKWGDFLWGAGFGLMVSERFKQIYEQEGLQGIVHFWPQVEIVRMGTKKTGDLTPQPPAYSLVDINWDGANLDDMASGVVRRRMDCEYCRSGYIERYGGIMIEPESWRGVDIFKARGLPGVIIVSERFVEVVSRQKLRNVQLTPAGKYAYDERRTRYASPWYIKDGLDE
jgi:hypothetical protein